MVLETFLETLRQYIKDNVQDPNQDRWSQGEEWVYTENTVTQAAKYPLVHIQPVSNPRTVDGVNSSKRRVTGRIQITIWWSLQDTFSPVGGEDVVQPSYALETLTENIAALIDDNQSTLTAQTNIRSVKTIDCNRTPALKKTLIKNDLDIQIQWRTK